MARAVLARVFSRLRTSAPGTGRRRLAASGLFDGAGYLTTYPDVRDNRLAPLDHFMLHGWREGRDPNPMFSVRWYLSNNPDVARAGVNPLLHYVMTGEREGRSPSPDFNPRRYAEGHPRLSGSPGGLLAHRLAHSRVEWRSGRPRPPQSAGEAVTDARLTVVKPAPDIGGRGVALLACAAAAGRLGPDVKPLVERLSTAGYAVGVVASADAPVQMEPAFADRLSALYVREAKCAGWAVWAHLFRIEPSLFDAEPLLLADARALPTGSQDGLTALLDRMAAVDADVVGLTDSYRPEWHILSDVLLVKRRALASVAFQRFIFSLRSPQPEDLAAGRHEIGFASALRAAGLDCTVLHPSFDRPGSVPEPLTTPVDTEASVPNAAMLQTPPTEGVDADEGTRRLRRSAHDEVRVAASNPPHDGAMGAAPRARNRGDRSRLDFIGTWEGTGADAALGRRLIEGFWRAGLPANLRPLPGGREREVIDFDGPADAAVVQVTARGGPSLGPPLDAAIARAGMTIGVLPPEVRPTLAADAFWASFGPAQGACDGAIPVIRLPGLTEGGSATLQDLSRAMVESLASLAHPLPRPSA